ncbi:MAG: septation protein A [Hyphomicrobiaceae bacterium]
MTDRETTSTREQPDAQPTPSGLKPLLEFGPLLIFFAVYAFAGIFAATAAFIPVTLAALAAERILLGKVGILPLVTAVFVVVFGGLTLLLADETFIKVKPTLVYLLFAAVALVGLAFNWVVWKQLFGEVFQLTDLGWRKMQFRWGCFFLALAILNEIVWRSLSTDAWVTFKVFGVLPLTFIFALAQVPLIQRHPPVESGANGNNSATNGQNRSSSFRS